MRASKALESKIKQVEDELQRTRVAKLAAHERRFRAVR